MEIDNFNEMPEEGSDVDLMAALPPPRKTRTTDTTIFHDGLKECVFIIC